jgi:hypothetical protein
MNSKTIWVVVAVVVIAAIIWIATGSKKTSQNQTNQSNANTTTKSTNQTSGSQTPNTVSNALKGTLKISDNQALGNLMLVTSTSNVYLRTSRDFSNLVNKQVALDYDGTITNFKLVDIKAQ